MSTLHFILHVILLYPHLIHSKFCHQSAIPSRVWTNSPFTNISYSDGTQINPIFICQSPSSSGPAFGFGFYCSKPCNLHFLCTFIVLAGYEGNTLLLPDSAVQVVWLAKRDTPVQWNATLELTKDGDLLLNDVDGSFVWSTKSSGKSVASMNLTESGNLVLFNGSGGIVWQSFDYPTDTLLSGQTLRRDQMLTANASATNWSRGQPYISYTTNIGFQALVGSNPPQDYFNFSMNSFSDIININSTFYPCFLNVTSNALIFSSNFSSSDRMISNSPVSPLQFLRLEFDGHLKLYEWSSSNWSSTADVINLDYCMFPMACGAYGLCHSGHCSACPQDPYGNSYFKQVDFPLVDSNGCVAITPLSCNSIKRQDFLELPETYNFNYMDDTLLQPNTTTPKSCKKVCLNNCSCKAAFFLFGANESEGSCYLYREVFSLINRKPSLLKSTAYIKVQYASNRSPSTLKIVGIAIGALLGLATIGSFLAVVCKRWRPGEEKMPEDEEFLQIPGCQQGSLTMISNAPPRTSCKSSAPEDLEQFSVEDWQTERELQLKNWRVFVKESGSFLQRSKPSVAFIISAWSGLLDIAQRARIDYWCMSS